MWRWVMLLFTLGTSRWLFDIFLVIILFMLGCNGISNFDFELWMYFATHLVYSFRMGNNPDFEYSRLVEYCNLFFVIIFMIMFCRIFSGSIWESYVPPQPTIPYCNMDCTRA